jgi:hypothetical protein
MKKFVLFVVLLAAVICCVSCAPNSHIHAIDEVVLVTRPRSLVRPRAEYHFEHYRRPLGKDGPDVDYQLTHMALLPEQLYFTEYRKHEN